MNERSTVLLDRYLKQRRLPTIARAYPTAAREAADRNRDYLAFLADLCEQHQLARRIQAAQFPWPETLDEFDFSAVPGLNKAKVLDLARGHFVREREPLLLVGNPGLGTTHLACAIGRACCQQGYRVACRTAAALANDRVVAQHEYRLNKLLKQFRAVDRVVVDERGYLPFEPARAQLLFQFFGERYDHGSVLVTTNREFARWNERFGDERMTAALLDRRTFRGQVPVVAGER